MENISCSECGYPTVCSDVEKDSSDKFLTKEDLQAQAIAKAFSRSVKAKVTPLERALNAYFTRFARKKITDLRRKGTLRMFAGGKVAKAKIKKQLTPEEEDEFINIVFRYGESAKDEEAKKAIKELGLSEAEVLPLIWPSSQRTTKRRILGETIRNINSKSDTAIRDILAMSTQETLRPSVSELSRRVTEALKGPSGIMSPAEAKKIASTEIPSFKNFAKHEVYKKAGVSKLRWVSVIDSRTRPARERVPRANHIVMDGRETEVGKPFDMAVSGAKMFYPGDPDGPPFEVINCRCTLMPIK